MPRKQIDCLDVVESCIEAYEKGFVMAVAARYGELEEYAREGLITDIWRDSLPESSIHIFFKKHQLEGENEWQRQYAQLKRIVDYGGILIYEEMMVVLSLRSDLEFGKYYAGEGGMKQLLSVDQDLRQSIADNKKVQSDCIVKIKKSIGRVLPKAHWWWE